MRAPHASHAVQQISSQVLVQSFVTPPGKVYLLYGDNLIFQLSLRMAASAMAQGKPIAVVDGCNQFNVHLLSRFARERHLNPEQFLNLIFISRGFTCYQMEQAIASRLPVFLEDIHSNTAMIFGLLDTFYDEQAPFREVQQILKRLSYASISAPVGPDITLLFDSLQLFEELFILIQWDYDCLLYTSDAADE